MLQDTISRLRGISGECILRHAAGEDWLVRVKQDGGHYIKPVRLNDAGASIWRSIAEGAKEEDLLNLLSEGEKVTAETHSDLDEFLTQLCAALEI